MNTEQPFSHPSLESALLSLAAGIESRFGSTCHLASLAVVAMFSLLRPDSAVAAIAPPLGAATSFAVLGATPNVNNTGPTAITGDMGVSPAAAIIGFPPGTIIGTLHTADALAASAQVDNTSAYGFLAGQACDTTFAGPTDLAGLTLVPGVYCFATSAANSGSLTLNAGGNANAVWIFRTASTLITGSGSSVVLTNGAQACNVFWQVGSSATLGTTTTFVGNILALTSITLQTGASLSGRALAQTGTVTLASNNVSLCTLAPPPPPPPTAPTLVKAFSPASVNAGAISTLTITLSNANATVATLSAPLVDSLPAGLVVAPTPNASTSCGGGTSVTATAGGNTVTLPSGRSIPANGSCTVSVNVTAALAGSYVNSLPIGALQTSNGNNPAAAVATLTTVLVIPPPPPPVPPTLVKAFSPASINAGAVSTLTITLSNANATVATLSAPLVDSLPAGLVVAPTPNASTTCGGGTSVTAAAGGNTVTLPSGRSIPASGSCTVSVDLTAALAGSYVNTLLVGALQTSNGNNPAAAVATLTTVLVIPPPPPPPPVPPRLVKAFSPASINAGAVSTLTITLSNANATVATLSAPLVDSLPAGLVVAPTPNASTSCGGGTSVTATAGGNTVTLPSGRSIPASGSCTVSVDLTAALAGSYVNSLPIGALQTSNGNNPAAAGATLTTVSVLPPPPIIAPSVGIPALSEWVLFVLTSLLAVIGVTAIRRQVR